MFHFSFPLFPADGGIMDIDTPFCPHLSGCTRRHNDPATLAGLTTRIDSAGAHPYLLDHVFGGEVFVPATMVMELFAEAALWFASKTLGKAGLGVVALRQFVIERGLTMHPGNALEARILLHGASPAANGYSLRMEIRSARANAQGKAVGDRRNAVCTVVLGTVSFDPVSVPRPPERFRAYGFQRDELYRIYFPSLGPKFHTQVGSFEVSESRRYFTGRYDCQDLEPTFLCGQAAPFALSPLGYDTCLQCTVLLSRIMRTVGRLPIGCDELFVHRRHPARGECEVSVLCNQIDDSVMSADLIAIDCDGRPLLSARNVRVQYAPVNQINATYRDEWEFKRILGEHETGRRETDRPANGPP
jgi:hypothetical protein